MYEGWFLRAEVWARVGTQLVAPERRTVGPVNPGSWWGRMAETDEHDLTGVRPDRSSAKNVARKAMLKSRLNEADVIVLRRPPRETPQRLPPAMRPVNA